jgi:hypothetical protein
MPEGFKNVGLMFYRMMKAIIKEQMERNVFAYVDDIVVVSRKKDTQLRDLAETFANMRRAKAQSREMCIWRMQRKSVMLLNIGEGNRG